MLDEGLVPNLPGLRDVHNVSVELDRIRAVASPLLVAARNLGPAGAAAFKPREDDFARVFDATILDAAVAHYAALWKHPTEITANPDQSELLVRAARSEDLQDTNTFPGGYKQIARHLVPGRIWLAWKFVRPPVTVGMAYDGLVWLGDHFAWFPKPWRLLSTSIDPFYVD